ncbi:MAG: outer membrane protein assembly factor BamB [Porticoccaceae bacterium]|jgi:outer membrane protein assembly factor BamB
MRILIPLIAVALLSGCSTLKFWEDDEVDELAPAELVDFTEEVRVEKLWSRGVGGQDELYSSLRPALLDNVIYAANDSGKVVAINASNGKVLWKEDVDQDISGGVGVGGDLVLVADIEGRIFALDRNSGDLRWKTNIKREVLSAPASNGDEVVVQTLDGFLVGLNGNNGGELWRYRADIPSLTLRAPTSPLITGNTVIAGFANGKLVALNTASGALLWENRVALPKGRSELERMVDIAGSPIIEGDMVYVTSYHGRAAAVTRGTGRSIWYQDLSSVQQPGYGMDQLYITQDNDEVKALRATSGQVLWSNVQMTYRQLSAPGYAGGYVAVGDAEGYLHVLSANDGRMVGRKKVDGSGVSAPILSDGRVVYVFDNDGDITAFTFKAK